MRCDAQASPLVASGHESHPLRQPQVLTCNAIVPLSRSTRAVSAFMNGSAGFVERRLACSWRCRDSSAGRSGNRIRYRAPAKLEASTVLTVSNRGPRCRNGRSRNAVVACGSSGVAPNGIEKLARVRAVRAPGPSRPCSIAGESWCLRTTSRSPAGQNRNDSRPLTQSSGRSMIPARKKPGLDPVGQSTAGQRRCAARHTWRVHEFQAQVSVVVERDPRHVTRVGGSRCAETLGPSESEAPCIRSGQWIGEHNRSRWRPVR